MVSEGDRFSTIGECAGIITAIGTGVAHLFQIGDRVCCWNVNNTFSSQTRVKATFVQKIPSSWSTKISAIIPQNISLAYFGLSDCAQLTSGQTVLLHGVDGHFGQAVALVANLLGIEVIATAQEKSSKESLVAYIMYMLRMN